MRFLSVDFGSYSLKIVESNGDKKGHRLFSTKIIPLHVHGHIPEANEHPLDHSLKMLRDHLSTLPKEVKLHLCYPSSFVTTRLLKLPLKNKKKAMLAIPFQLEEDIPYTWSNTHFGAQLRPEGDGINAHVSITGREEYSAFHSLLAKYELAPDLITTEPSILAQFFFNKEILGSFCILDLGHRMTRAHFFFEGKLISTETSYTAGAAIDEAIATTYKISLEEASLFKHQNVFCLTEKQFQEVDEAQRFFGELMQRVLQPLVLDFRRWELGFRVKQGSIKLNTVFITGGTSLIRNLGPYLTQELGHVVNGFDSFEGIQSEKEITPDQKRILNMAHALALAGNDKSKSTNLASGEFALESGEILPLHGIGFYSLRIAMVALALVLFFFGQNTLLDLKNKKLDKEAAELLGDPSLEINKRYLKRLTQDGPAVLTQLRKRNESLKEDLKILEESLYDPLPKLLSLFGDWAKIAPFSLASFKWEETSLAQIKAKGEKKNLEALKLKIENQSEFSNLFIDLDDKKNEMTSTFEYKP